MDYSMLTPRQHRASKYLTDITIGDLDLDGEKCSICHEPLLPNPNTVEEIAPEPLVRTGCGHIFGKGCILRWLKYSDNCPYCRTRLPGSEPLGLDQWRVERESIIRNIDAIVQKKPHRRLATSLKGRRETTNIVENQPRWLCALRLKGFLLLETSTDKLPTEQMERFILHFANYPTRMTNYELAMTLNCWADEVRTEALDPDYCSNVDDVLRAVVRGFRMHGVKACLAYTDSDGSDRGVYWGMN